MGATRPAALVCLTIALSACAGRRAAPVPQAEQPGIARAESLLREGCYRCLEEALALVQPLAARPGAARGLAFDAALLLAARDRELGMRAADHLPLARSLAPGAPDERSRILLDVVSVMPWPAVANGPEERDRTILGWRALEPAAPGWHGFLSSRPAEDMAAGYLLAGLECTWPQLAPARKRPSPDAVAPVDRSEPAVLRFRRALCDRPRLDDVLSMREQAPRFEELELAAADAAMQGGALLTAERHYRAAWQAFPPMLPAAHGLARVHVMLEEYEASVPEYDAVLAVIPDQQDCLLGKARALSQLGRHAEAIPLLDRLIALGTWLLGDAHYWRGWNRLRLDQVDSASADAEAALGLMVNARVHVLAGAVAARRADWNRAGREFESALPLDDTDCDIPLSLASVRGQQRGWAAAYANFARGVECLVASQAQLARRIEEIAAAPMSEERRARFSARTRAAMAAEHMQEGQSRYNAAVSLANLGRTDEARVWAGQAAAWPEWKDRATALASGRRP